MNWISFEQLHQDVARFADMLPADLVGVVGVPRSGCMVASLIALQRHIHLSDAETFTRTGGFYTAGERLDDVPMPTSGKVLLVDDSAGKCKSIDAATVRIQTEGRQNQFELIRGAVYTTNKANRRLDVSYRILPAPRVFEWHLFSHDILYHTMVEADDVLFGSNGRLLNRPRRRIGLMALAISEAARAIAEKLLAQDGIDYGTLILLPDRKTDSLTHFAECYRNSRCELYLCNRVPQEAQAIAQAAGKPVLNLFDKVLYE